MELTMIYIVMAEGPNDEIYAWSDAYVRSHDAYELMEKWEEDYKNDPDVKVFVKTFGIKQ